MEPSDEHESQAGEPEGSGAPPRAQDGPAPPAITTLDQRRSGRYLVTTAHGTRHLIDLDRRVAVRYGAPGRGWDGSDRGFGGPVTPDGRPLWFSSLTGATVGRRMRIENGDEWRLTSIVVSIEEVGEDWRPGDDDPRAQGRPGRGGGPAGRR